MPSPSPSPNSPSSPRFTVQREHIHKIVRITPGVIASGILAIWLFSADTVRTGDETNIDYAFRHRIYNRILFLNADKPGDHGVVGIEKLDDGKELEDIFAQAPSVEPQARQCQQQGEGPASRDTLPISALAPLFPLTSLFPQQPSARPSSDASHALPTAAPTPLVKKSANRFPEAACRSGWLS
ncbi:hypothetical protein C8R44DRAFT_879206 [Mycena epipterygia]|nr:hypothetical protein C8R44DRAFT_879206 [Mycena epipterygia]